MSALLEPFREPFMRQALVEVLILGAVCGPLGTWVLAFRHAYAAESLSHSLFPGLVIAVLAGLPLVLGAGVGVVAAALAIALAARDRRLGADAGVAVVVTTLLGAGALLALAPANPARLEELLFGDLLAVRAVDLAVAGALAALVLVALAAGHRRLVLAAFDPASAGSLGAPPRRVELAVLVLLAVAVVAAVQGLGNLLVLSLIVGPAAAARRLGRRPPETLLIAAALAMAAGVAGLYASYELDIAGGAAVALASTAVFVLSLAGGRWSVGRLGPGGDPGALRLAGRRPRRQAS